MRVLITLLAALALAAAGCGGDDESAPETTATSGGECESVDAPAARDPGSREAPTSPLDASTTYTLTFETSCGSFTVTLLIPMADSSPRISMTRSTMRNG